MAIHHSKPVDQRAQDAFNSLVSGNHDSIDTATVLNSITTILGRTSVGDNQITDVAKPGTTHREPAFHLDDAQVKDVNGRKVLEVTGWFTPKDNRGQPKVDSTGDTAKRYYDGIFTLDANHKGLVSELYLTADDATTYSKGKVDFNKALSSIQWK